MFKIPTKAEFIQKEREARILEPSQRLQRIQTWKTIPMENDPKFAYLHGIIMNALKKWTPYIQADNDTGCDILENSIRRKVTTEVIDADTEDFERLQIEIYVKRLMKGTGIEAKIHPHGDKKYIIHLY